MRQVLFVLGLSFTLAACDNGWVEADHRKTPQLAPFGDPEGNPPRMGDAFQENLTGDPLPAADSGADSGADSDLQPAADSDPLLESCSGCLNGYADCDSLCRASLGDYFSGTCEFPASTDPDNCCACVWDGPQTGTSGGPCFSNATCNGSLLCYNGECKNDHRAVNGLPGLIVDAHVHFDKSDLSRVSELVDVMNSLGVDKGVMYPGCSKDHGGTAGDDAVWSAYEQYPHKFWPCLAGFDPTSPSAETYVHEQLTTRNWRCIGEVYLRWSPGEGLYIPADHPNMMPVYELAGLYGIPVFIHFEPQWGTSNVEGGLAELRFAVQQNPNTQFIWLHGCNGGYEELAVENENLECSADGNQQYPYSIGVYGVGSDIGCTGLLTAPDGTTYENYIDDIRQRLDSMDAALAEEIRYTRIWDLMER